MSIAVFSPYGLASEESGILALIANYLQQGQYAVSWLQCNGAFSLCDRDAETAWRRGLRNCFACMHEQSAISHWANVPTHELTRSLHPEDVAESKRWSLKVSKRSIDAVLYEDIEILPLVRQSFFTRTGKESPELASDDELETLRRMALSSVRMIMAGKRFLKDTETRLVLVAGGDDHLSAAFIAAARSVGVAVAQFRWDMVSRSVLVTHPAAERAYSCPLVFEDVTSMRSDSRTWPGEIVRIVDELMVFLEISTSQIQLPLAQ